MPPIPQLTTILNSVMLMLFMTDMNLTDMARFTISSPTQKKRRFQFRYGYVGNPQEAQIVANAKNVGGPFLEYTQKEKILKITAFLMRTFPNYAD